MGSKQYMLKNGLAKLLEQEVPKAKRFIDPFAGSCSVVTYVAQKFDKEVVSSDLQDYSKILAEAVLLRTGPVDIESLKKIWISKARDKYKSSKPYKNISSLESSKIDTRKLVKKARELCSTKSNVGPIWNAYGGHYYAPSQALAIDHLMKLLPEGEIERAVSLAALIRAASKLATAPGHTAQPLQPKETGRANILIKQLWSRDVFGQVEKELEAINDAYARKKGKAVTCEVLEMIKSLRNGDLIFLDPPYTGVQYSRFYHVLETIARGKCGDVSGVGRYPVLKERPQSKFSNSGQSLAAFDELMSQLAKKKVSVILTFPSGECSNGLSGALVKKTVSKYFKIVDEDAHVRGYFSTMGGNGNNRPHKVESKEMLLLMKSL